AGTLVKSGGGTTTIGLRFHNTGTVTIQSGTINFTCGMFGPNGCSGPGGAGIAAPSSAHSDALFAAVEPVRELAKALDSRVWLHTPPAETRGSPDGAFCRGIDSRNGARAMGDQRDRRSVQYDANPVSRERESTERSAMSARHDAADTFFQLLAESVG